MAVHHEEAINIVWELIYELEEEKYFKQHYDEELEKCDVFMEKGNVNELSYKQLQEVTEENGHYMMMRAVIESIKQYKEDFEKQVRAKEAYKKVVKKQSDKIKELKKEIEKVKKERYTDKQLEELIKEVDFEDIDCDCLPVENEFNIENWLHDIKEQIEEKIDREEIEELREDNEKLEKIIRSVGHQETIEACNKIWYDEEEESQEEEEEDDGHYAVCETCDKKLYDDGKYSSITSCTYCDDCYEKLDSDEKEEDGCWVCGRNFNLEYSISCNKKAYDKYLGSDKDDGDICLYCIGTIEYDDKKNVCYDCKKDISFCRTIDSIDYCLKCAVKHEKVIEE